MFDFPSLWSVPNYSVTRNFSMRNPYRWKKILQTPIWRFPWEKVIINPAATPFQEFYQEDMRPLYIRLCRCDGLRVGEGIS